VNWFEMISDGIGTMTCFCSDDVEPPASLPSGSHRIPFGRHSTSVLNVSSLCTISTLNECWHVITTSHLASKKALTELHLSLGKRYLVL
jgi:hypothetical protein